MGTDARTTHAKTLRDLLTKDDEIAPQPHPTSGDEQRYHDFRGNFSKGLTQQPLPAIGLVEPSVFKAFRHQTLVETPGPGTPNFEVSGIKTGGKLNGPLGAFAYQTLGHDSSFFGDPTVPAPPAMASAAYGVELIELYWASLLRDVPFSQYSSNQTANDAAAELTGLSDYAGPRQRDGTVTADLLFRGGLTHGGRACFSGETTGPYVSQFLLQPTALGVLPLDQKLNVFAAGKDYLTDVPTWWAVQNGATFPKPPYAGQAYAFNGRGLATYTHQDELYQAYLVAYLILSGANTPSNPGSPYRKYNNQKPFATFGGPDIASTIAAIARAAIDAVWYQKWVVHLRHRPESGGGIVHSLKTDSNSPFKGSLHENILNSKALTACFTKNQSYLLSQAFPEGAPTHPAYPTGHGTVGGACITALKFFFDCSLPFAGPVVSNDGTSRTAITDALTINGELNKLAHNISFGHGIHAGIHWRSDTDYSILLGEAVALKFLHDQAKTYAEHFNITIQKFDGTDEVISN